MKNFLILLISLFTALPAFSREYYPDSTWYNEYWTYVHTIDIGCNTGYKTVACFNGNPSNDFIKVIEVNAPGKPTHYHLVLSTKITAGLVSTLEPIVKELRATNKANGYRFALKVYLNSAGGDAQSGIEIGRMLRANYVHTVISADNVCASACADIWIGGYYRDIFNDGKMTVHAPYIKGKYGTSTCISITHKDAEPFKQYAIEMLGTKDAIEYNKASFNCSVIGGTTYTEHSVPWQKL